MSRLLGRSGLDTAGRKRWPAKSAASLENTRLSVSDGQALLMIERALALDGNRDLQTSPESGLSGREGHSFVS